VCPLLLQTGTKLAERHRDQLRWWVRCFIFGLEDPIEEDPTNKKKKYPLPYEVDNTKIMQIMHDLHLE
jgi:hypothetical protein